MVEKWELFPFFTEEHKFRYLVKLKCSREDIDVIYKKFSPISEEPFEIPEGDYNFGIYVNCTSKEERVMIEKFLEQLTGEVKSILTEENIKSDKKKETPKLNVENVLSELNVVLSNLTKEEKEKIEEKIAKMPQPKVEPEVEVKKEEVVEEIKPVPAPIQEEVKIPVEQPIGLRPKPEITPINVEPEFEKPVVTPPPPPSPSPPPDQPQPQIQPSTKGDIPAGMPVLNVGYIYPTGGNIALETFLKQLENVTMKTMKTPIFLKKIFTKEYALDKPDFSEIINEIKSSTIDTLFSIIPVDIRAEKIKTTMEEEFNKEKIDYIFAPIDQIEKRFLYVDIGIELMLRKNKLKK